MRRWTTKNKHTVTQLVGGRSNVFLLSYGDKNILIDTGTKGQWKKLNHRLEQLDIDCLDYLVLTHTHNDHAANACKIREKYKAMVIVHTEEVTYLTEGRPIIPKGTNFYSRMLVNTFGEIATPWFRYEPCPYDIVMDNYFDFKEKGINASIIHTPGHSSGSITLIVDNEIALLGDVMIGRGIYYTYPPFADDPSTLICSWKKLLDTQCSLFIPSHGRVNTRKLLEKVYAKKAKLFSLE